MHARTKVIDIRPYLARRERERRLLEAERRRHERNQAILDQYRPRRPKPVRGPGGAG